MTNAKYYILLSAAVVISSPVADAKPAAGTGSWQILEEESVSLAYRVKDASQIEISCGDASGVTVPVAPGITPPADQPTPTYDTGGKQENVLLDVEVCGGDILCTDRKDGEVSVYSTISPGKSMALAIASTATSMALAAPGVDLSLIADASTFKRFEGLCKTWK